MAEKLAWSALVISYESVPGLATHPIDDQHLPGNIRAGLAAEEEQRSSKVFGLTPPTSRDPFRNLAETCRICEELFVHVGCDIPRSNSIDLHIVSGPLVGEGLDELSDGALGGGISGYLRGKGGG